MRDSTGAGQEYNHDLLACETGVHAGQLPAAASLCEVTSPSAMLSALKPHGNPLASGRPAPPRREDGVTVRLRDAGRGPGPGAAGTAARVRLFTAPGTARLWICRRCRPPRSSRARQVLLPR